MDLMNIWSGKNYVIKHGRNKQYIINNIHTGINLYVIKAEDINVHPEVSHAEYYYIMRDLDDKYFAVNIPSYILIEKLMSGWSGRGIWLEEEE